MIDFKWNNYGFKFHLFGTVIHFVYMIILFIYTNNVYVHNEEISLLFLFSILGFISYPLVYELIQMHKMGLAEYFSDFGNYLDIVFIWGSVAMTITHVQIDPHHYVSRCMMIIVLLSAIRRTFSFLRIFSQLSHIVTMLSQVILDLRSFMTFFFIMCTMFSMMFGVIGLGNVNIDGPFREENYDPESKYKMPIDRFAPGVEFRQIGLLAGNLIQTLRLATGDFAIID